MQEMIDRLTRCGIPKTTAICVCSDFERRGKADSLTAYVCMVEAQHDR